MGLRKDVPAYTTIHASRYGRTGNIQKYFQLFQHHVLEPYVLDYHVRLGSKSQVQIMVDLGADPLAVEPGMDFIHTAALNHSHGMRR